MKTVRSGFTGCYFGVLSCLGWVSFPFFLTPPPSNSFSYTSGCWIAFFIIILYLYLVPLGTYSPCIQEKDKLRPKPDFFGHRGAPMVGLSVMDVGEYKCVSGVRMRLGDLRTRGTLGNEKGLALDDQNRVNCRGWTGTQVN